MKDVTDPFESFSIFDLIPREPAPPKLKPVKKGPSDAQVAKWIEEKKWETRKRTECTSKRAFDKRAAMTIINSGRTARRNKTRFEMKAYQCTFCNQWHLATEEYD